MNNNQKISTEKTIKTDVNTQPTQKNVAAGNYIQNWGGIIEKLKQNGKIMLYTNLLNTKAVEINDMTIGIEFNNGVTAFGKSIIESPDNIKDLELAVSTELGKQMHVKIIENSKKVITKTKSTGDDMGLPINVIE